MKRVKEWRKVVFLLGAGASVDAGMPAVAQLTSELRQRLPTLPDFNGNQRSEFGEVFDFIAAHDPLVAKEYERLFKWMRLILEVGEKPFRGVIRAEVKPSMADAIAHLAFVIGGEIGRLLTSRSSDPGYLARLGDFLPVSGRLKVFSLNYDCCVEDACRQVGIDIATGFDPAAKTWNPRLFRRVCKGINLYKLHGSIRWFGMRDESLKDDQSQHHLKLVELQPGQSQELPAHFKVGEDPELVLGPGSKVQSDDPFLTLMHEFWRSVKEAQVCVVIGYSHRDTHINNALEHALDAGVVLLDVNPTGPCSRYLADARYHHLGLGAKTALMDGKIPSELDRLRQ